jgi:hypothetical protein
LSTGSTSTPIAIIDSGVDPAHPDLAGKLLPGYNFLAGNTDTHDVLWHGTAVAGTAAAMTNNAAGVAGVGWENPIVPLVVLNASNWASYSNIASAITYAVDHGVKVMNISIGGSSSSSTMQQAVDYAWNRGAVIVACAMNNNSTTPMYPAALNHVVAVAATDPADLKTSFSNYGSWIDVSAPGINIYTTDMGGGYGTFWGTSFASPITAAVAAVIRSANPLLTNSEVVAFLQSTADDLGDPGFDILYGWGRVNLHRALQAAGSTLPAPDTAPPVTSVTSPADGATVSGVISVAVSATDDTGVTSVELWKDGGLMATDALAPFAFVWDTVLESNGSHTLMSKAYDAMSNMGTSAPVTVTVSNSSDVIAPSVAITFPVNGATVPKKSLVTITATASDETGVSRVEFYVGNSLACSDTTAGYSCAWKVPGAPNKRYTLQAKAYDLAGNVSSSPTVTVTSK